MRACTDSRKPSLFKQMFSARFSDHQLCTEIIRQSAAGSLCLVSFTAMGGSLASLWANFIHVIGHRVALFRSVQRQHSNVFIKLLIYLSVAQLPHLTGEFPFEPA